MPQIRQEHLDFLKQIGKNNNREWFKKQKPHFDKIYGEVKVFFHSVYEEMMMYDKIEEYHVQRIYRNLRFSKDKTPFKTHFSLYLGRQKPLLRGGYYLNIEPGNCFVAGGFWHPERDDLLRIRKEIAADPGTLRKVLASKKVKDYFGALRGRELKTAPKGFNKNDPAVDLLRKQQLLLNRSFTDEEVQLPNFKKEAVLTFRALRPFFDYMSEVLTTNENGESLF